jgi:hypothetical protein
MLDMTAQASAGRWPGLQNQAARSQVMKRVHPLNPLPRLRFLADIPDYKKLLEDPEAQRIFEDPGNKPFARLCNHPKFRMAAGDPQLRLLIEQRNWREVMVNEKVLALVFDREVRDILNELGPWTRAALKEAERLRSKGAAG